MERELLHLECALCGVMLEGGDGHTSHLANQRPLLRRLLELESRGGAPWKEAPPRSIDRSTD